MNSGLSTVPLVFRLGEVTLGKVVRSLIVIAGDPLQDPRGEINPDEEFLRLPQAEGVLYRSFRLKAKLPRLKLAHRKIQYVPRQYDRHFADLSTSYDDYLLTFSARSRSTLRRKVRRFAQESGGKIDWRCYKTTSEIDAFYVAAREVSRKTYQERLLDAGLPEDAEFRDSMHEAAKRDRVRAFLLFVDSQAVAYLYCPIENGVVKFAYLGYLPEYQRLSPGTVLLWLAMEQLFRERSHRWFDFTEGGDRSEHSQKRVFSTWSVPCADIYVLKLNPKNLVAIVTHLVVDFLSESVGKTLQLIGAKRAVKRITRGLWS